MARAAKKQRNEIRGDVLILFAMALFGTYSLFLRLMPEVSTLTFVFVFQIVGIIAFTLSFFKKGLLRLPARTYILLFGLAVAALANDLFYFAAFRNTTVANATVTHQSVSIFLLFLAPLLLRERTQKSEWLGLIPALIGVGIIYSSGIAVSSQHIFGITLGIMSGLFYALVIVFYRFISSSSGLGTGYINMWRYILSFLLLLPFISIFDLEALGSQHIIPLAAFGFLFAFIATGIHSYGISKSRPLHASIIGKTEPVFAILYAALFLNEIPSVRTIIGGALIIGVSIWLALRRQSQAGTQESLL